MERDRFTAKELYFLRGIHQGKARSAFWISFHLDTVRIWELLELYVLHDTHCVQFQSQYTSCFAILQQYDKLLGYTSPEYDIIIRCIAIMSVCIPSTKMGYSFSSFKSTIVLKDIELDTVSPHTRKYSIPMGCLYGRTQRGRNVWQKSTVCQLNMIEKYLGKSPYWMELLDKYGGITEQFYCDYFPNDIPDEWTKSEKNKSHGDGLLAPEEQCHLLKYGRNYLAGCSRLAYTTLYTSEKIRIFLQGIQSTDPSVIVTHFVTPCKINDDILKPVIKQLKYISITK
jgi:hypothetical protein